MQYRTACQTRAAIGKRGQADRDSKTILRGPTASTAARGIAASASFGFGGLPIAQWVCTKAGGVSGPSAEGTQESAVRRMTLHVDPVGRVA